MRFGYVVFILLLLALFQSQVGFALSYIMEGYLIGDDHIGGPFFIGTIFIFSTSLILYYLISLIRRKSLTKQMLWFATVNIGLLIIHLFQVVFSNDMVFLTKDLLYYLVLGLPGFIIGELVLNLNIANYIQLKLLKYFSIFILIVGDIFCLDYFTNLSPTRYLFTFGNLNYQATSYLFAFFSGFFLILLNRSYSWMTLLFYLNSVFLSLIGGGKGAFILVLFYFLIFGLSKFWKSSFIVSILGIIAFWSYMNGAFLNYSSSGIDRIITIFDSSVTLSEVSSERDIVYDHVIVEILEHPIFGIGPFNLFEQGIQPHNFILDFMLRFGLFLGGLLGFSVVFYLFYYFVNIRSLNIWILLFFPYVFISCSFSGTFFHEPLFFMLLYIVCTYPFFRPVLNNAQITDLAENIT